MRSSPLRQLAQNLFLLAGLSVSGGCATMGGNMANSSGMGYYEQGNYAAAANEFHSAMMSDPSNPDYIANLAKARMKMGDAPGSEQLYRQALTMSPSHQPSYHGLAELMMTQGRGQEAQAMMTTWAATQPYVAESHVELAWLQREMGQPDAAAQSLQKALQVNPSHPTALAHMGQYYEEIGRPDQAVAMYQNSLRSDWNQPEVHSRVAAASQSAGAASPMAATAMARGVHPYNIPRQQTAFGPPSPGAQMAQMQMAQRQMAMYGNPTAGQMMAGPMMPGPMAGQMAMMPNKSDGMMAGYYDASGWQQTNSPISQMPAPTAWTSFGTAAAGMNQPADNMSWPEASSIPFESPNSQAIGPRNVPTPDPAFSTKPSSTPATTISWAPSKSPASSGNVPPLVEAF